MSNPENGWAYNQFELAAIWDLPCPSASEIAETRDKVWRFHAYVGDAESQRLIERDTFAQLFDRKPEGILDYDAPFTAVLEDRYPIDVPQREGE